MSSFLIEFSVRTRCWGGLFGWLASNEIDDDDEHESEEVEAVEDWRRVRFTPCFFSCWFLWSIDNMS